MFIDIEKWHGAKNDFIVTWLLPAETDMIIPTLQRLAPKICTRDGSGIAADGILVLVSKSRKDPHPTELVIINSDGSLAKNCGNGLRCAAMSARRRAHREGIFEFDGVTMTVQGVAIDCRFLGKENSPFVAVTMPVPVVGQDNDYHQEIITSVKQLQSHHPKLKGDIETVSLGNPHVVLTVPESSVELAQAAGKPLQTSRSNDGINVHISSAMDLSDKDQQKARRDIGEDISELYRVFPWERGVGLTQACGTGACAVAVAVLATGLSERSMWIGIEMPGGRLYIQHPSEEDPVMLAGPAEFVFAGSLEI